MLVPPPQTVSEPQSSHCFPLMGTRASLHTCLLEDGCVRLLIKNLGTKMHEVFVREKLKTGFLSKESSSAAGSVTRNPPRPAP